jgi:hypothetical protein
MLKTLTFGLAATQVFAIEEALADIQETDFDDL